MQVLRAAVQDEAPLTTRRALGGRWRGGSGRVIDVCVCVCWVFGLGRGDAADVFKVANRDSGRKTKTKLN